MEVVALAPRGRPRRASTSAINPPMEVAMTKTKVCFNKCYQSSSTVDAHAPRPHAATFFENVEIRGNSWIEVDESVSESVHFFGQNGVVATVLNDKGK